jgi:hypothetical protein
MPAIPRTCPFLLILVLALPMVALAKAPRGETVDPALVVGDAYTIRVERHGTHKEFDGELVKANDRWIVLRHVTGGRRELSIPLISKLPLVGDGFRIRAIAARDEFLWIPREAATVEKHTASADPATAQPAIGDEPTLKVACAVEIAAGERIVRREGGMEALSDQAVTIAVPRKVTVENGLTAFGLPFFGTVPEGKSRVETRYSREQHARGDILCIHLANFEAAALAAQAQ